MKKLAILAYHKIGDPSVGGWYTWNYVPTSTFERQLQYLQEHDWEVIDEKRFLTGLCKPETLPTKAALITFDDGYRSNLEIAVPILKKLAYPAIVFVPTAFVNGYNAFDADIFYEPKEQICSWDELVELEKSNIAIQSHSVNHRHFSKLSEDEQLSELMESKKLLEEKLNKTIEVFSFPYGDYGLDKNKITKKLNDTGYKAACLYGGKPFDPFIGSHFQLERVAMGPDTNISIELSK
jgi:peptidoglycan/xylan/chitin deacetylase (PgdA/CDA1 family)